MKHDAHATERRYASREGLAREHARWIVDREQSAGVAVERSVQQALDFPVATRLLSYTYLAAQFVVLPGALIWLYRRAPDGS